MLNVVNATKNYTKKGGFDMRTKKAISIGIIVSVSLWFLFMIPAFAASKLPSIIGITTIGLGTSSHASTVAYAPFLEKYIGVPVRAMPSDSTKVSFTQMREKKALFGALSSISLGTALQGDRPYNVEGWGPQKIGLVWMGYDGPFGFVVRKNSPIKSIKDLKGKKVAWYTASPAWMMGAEASLRFAGLTLADVELVRLGSYAACARAVAEGKADADYVSAVSGVTFEIAQGPSGIRYLPMPLEDKEGWNRFGDVNPLIGKGICKKGVEEARGIPMANHIFVTTTYLDTDTEHIYQVARFFGEAYGQYKDQHADLKDMSLEAMRQLLDTKCLPVHPGTIKYLKEKGLWTAADDQWNNKLLENINRYEKAWIMALKEAKEKGVEVDLKNEKWLKLWDEHRAKLPVFKMQ
jgi:TRAP transporter TAXI family solute receptor